MGTGSQDIPVRQPAPLGPPPHGAPAGLWGVPAPGPTSPWATRPAVLSAAPNAVTLLGALRRRWVPAAALGALAAAVASAAVWYTIPPSRHVAKAMLHVSSNRPNIIFSTQEIPINFDIYKQTQLRLLKSRSVLSAVIRNPEVKKLDLVKQVTRQGDTMAWLEREVQADYTGEILNISMSGNGPDGLATVVNAVAEAYLEEVVNVEAKERRKRYEQLQKIYTDFSTRLKEKRAELQKLARQIGSADQSNVRLTHALALENRAMMERELLRLRMDLRQAEIELAVQRDAPKPGGGAAPSPGAAVRDAVDNDGLVREYRARIKKLNNTLFAAKMLARENSDPSVRRPQEEIRNLTRLLRERETEIRLSVTRGLGGGEGEGSAAATAALEDRVRVLKEMERLVAADVKNLSNDAGAINQNSMSLETVQNEIAITEAAAKRVGNEVEALNVELDAPSRVRLIEPADTPYLAADTRLRSAGLAGLAALALVVAGVSFAEFRSRRVGSADEVVHGLGLRVIGTLPALPRRPSKAAAGRDGARMPWWHTHLIEAVDNARTNLLYTTAALPLRSVLVTSAVGGEGKTSLACNLATSIARAGLKTLLIDGDLRSPDVHKVFDLPARPGLSELLRDEADLAAAVHQAAVRNLWVLTAGLCDDRALRALAQEKLRVLFDRLKERFDFIVVDAPPVLPVADAVLIARHADAVVQAVLNGVSVLPMVYAAHERLQGLGIRTLGVVVAGVRGPDYGGDAYTRGRTESAPAGD